MMAYEVPCALRIFYVVALKSVNSAMSLNFSDSVKEASWINGRPHTPRGTISKGHHRQHQKNAKINFEN